MEVMSMADTRTRNESFSQSNYNFGTPSGAPHDMPFSADTLVGDLQFAPFGVSEDEDAEDDSEEDAVLASPDPSIALAQAGLSLIVDNTTTKQEVTTAYMGNIQKPAQDKSLTANEMNEINEDDDDTYSAIDDIPEDQEEDMTDPLQVNRLLHQDELPSDPVNDVPMRSIEVDDGVDAFLARQSQPYSDDLHLLSPTSVSKADFAAMFPDSGYEAESDNETIMDDYSTMMTSTFSGSVNPAETLISSPLKNIRRENRFARTKKARPPKMGTFVVPKYKATVIPYSDSNELEIRPAKRLPTDADIEQIVSNRKVVLVTACCLPPPETPEQDLAEPTQPLSVEDPFTVFPDPTLGHGTTEAMLSAVDMDNEHIQAPQTSYEYPLFVSADINLNLFKTLEANSDQESDDSDCDSNFSTFFDLDADLGDSKKRKASNAMPLPAANLPRAKRIRV